AVQCADVGNGDGAAFEIILADAVGAGGLSQPGDFLGDTQQGELFTALDVGHHQASFAIYRHANVAVGQVVDFGHILVQLTVQHRVFPDSQGHGFHKERHEG